MNDAAHLVAGHLGHRRRQRAHLHDARHLERLAHLLAFDHRLGHAHALQRDRALRRERRREHLVVGVEHAAGLVQHLHHADQHVLVIDERQREHAARAVAGRAVDAGIEARIGVAVGNVDDAPIVRARADQAGARRHADRRDACRDQ